MFTAVTKLSRRAARRKQRLREIEREVKKEEDGGLIMTEVRFRCTFGRSRVLCSSPCWNFDSFHLIHFLVRRLLPHTLVNFHSPLFRPRFLAVHS
jgi:hypothetical protein